MMVLSFVQLRQEEIVIDVTKTRPAQRRIMVFDLFQESPQLVYLLPIRAMYLLSYRGLDTMRACCVE